MKHFFGGPRLVWLATFLFSFFPPQNWNEKNKCIFMHRCKYLAWLSALIFILFYIVTQNVLDLYILTIFSYIDNIPSNNISHLIFNQHFNKIVIAQQIESFPYSRGVHCWCGCKMDCMKYRSFFIFPTGGIVIKSHRIGQVLHDISSSLFFSSRPLGIAHMVDLKLPIPAKRWTMMSKGLFNV